MSDEKKEIKQLKESLSVSNDLGQIYQNKLEKIKELWINKPSKWVELMYKILEDKFIMNCKTCNKEFTEDALVHDFCSEKCRLEYRNE